MRNLVLQTVRGGARPYVFRASRQLAAAGGVPGDLREANAPDLARLLHEHAVLPRHDPPKDAGCRTMGDGTSRYVRHSTKRVYPFDVTHVAI